MGDGTSSAYAVTFAYPEGGPKFGRLKYVSAARVSPAITDSVSSGFTARRARTYGPPARSSTTFGLFPPWEIHGGRSQRRH